MTIYRCDCCGFEKKATDKHIPFIAVNVFITLESPANHLDICGDCYRELSKCFDKIQEDNKNV